MDKYSYQLHIIPDRISQLAVMKCEFNLFKIALQNLQEILHLSNLKNVTDNKTNYFFFRLYQLSLTQLQITNHEKNTSYVIYLFIPIIVFL